MTNSLAELLEIFYNSLDGNSVKAVLTTDQRQLLLDLVEANQNADLGPMIFLTDQETWDEGGYILLAEQSEREAIYDGKSPLDISTLSSEKWVKITEDTPTPNEPINY